MKAAALRNSSADAKASLATRGLGPRGLDRGGGVAVFAMFMVCVAFLCFQFWLCNQWAAGPIPAGATSRTHAFSVYVALLTQVFGSQARL